jgi:hypothetical protein
LIKKKKRGRIRQAASLSLGEGRDGSFPTRAPPPTTRPFTGLSLPPPPKTSVTNRHVALIFPSLFLIGERLQVLQQNVNCLLEEYNQNGSWKEVAGSVAERRVTNRQRGLSEFIYRILLKISKENFQGI